MRLSPKLRGALLLVALAATLLAVYWASRLPGDEAAVAPSERGRKQSAAQQRTDAAVNAAGAPRANGGGDRVVDTGSIGAKGGNALTSGGGDPLAGGDGDAPANPGRSDAPASAGGSDALAGAGRGDAHASAGGGDAPASAGGGGALDLSRLQRPRSAEPSDDLFGRRNFAPAPPPAPKRPIAKPASVVAESLAPPPPPPAPPVPFTYLGRLAEGPQTTVFLAAGDRNLVVKAGDVIDNTYRVDEIGERVLVLTYLPQNLKQPIPIGAP